MTQPQVRATFCKSNIIIIIGSTALGGPWPPLYKSIAHCFKELFLSHQVLEDASWTYLIGINFKGSV